MIRLIQVYRLLQINYVLMRHNFVSSVIGEKVTFLRFLRYINPWYYLSTSQSRGESIRDTLISLGPIYVKFGQMLSTRDEFISEDITAELRKLQDQVPPFDGAVAKKIIEDSLQGKVDDIFDFFDATPLASASVAQVHAATLKSGEDVVIKVIRPSISKVIKQDIAVLYLVAKLTKIFWRHGKRLHPVELVAEFEQTLKDELDQNREAANASLLRRNFANSDIMYVPKVFWEYVSQHVMVMERIYGIPLNELDRLKNSGVNLKKLSKNGVEIFFTQVFRDGFFHADMHPGNLFIDITDLENPRYLGVDFGIMGTLTSEDQHYLALNLLAFFNRDYRRVAELHVECGWVAPETRVDQFESAIRTVCEPIFEKPLSDISFGKLLLRLFETAERFDMEVQPQLLLLQKTLFNIESLGKQLYPDLDLWETAKPFMVSWIKQRRSVKRLAKMAINDFHETVETILKTPQLLYEVLEAKHLNHLKEKRIQPTQKTRAPWFGMIGLSLLIVSISNAILLPHINGLTWFELGAGLAALLIALTL